MQLLDQRIKKIMEGCKDRAREAGLNFSRETLEYIITNQDLLELMPKNMIPTLYDFWFHDVELHKQKGKYKLYPSNPYETVINTRPPISFYNDNNPDWLNVMIFYHVLGHVDFFQNNTYFQRTWKEDFKEQALADKRRIAQLRSDHGRWVDYIIEFARQINNINNYYQELCRVGPENKIIAKMDYYFDIFLQQEKKLTEIDYLKEVEEFNSYIREYGKNEGERIFFRDVSKQRYPELEERYKRYCQEEKKSAQKHDLIKFLIDHSPKLQKSENQWMKEVLEIIRETALFFEPQIRTKIINEGWASYWHEKLFLQDERIKTHETDFSITNAKVTSMPKVGLNPYALGKNLWEYAEKLAETGKDTWIFQQVLNLDQRKNYNQHTGQGREKIFELRKNLNDFSFLWYYLDQDFVDAHRLFVSEKKFNPARQTWEYFVKSRNAKDYWNMIKDQMYHPPSLKITTKGNGRLKLYHEFEGKPLVQEYIQDVLRGLEFLWGEAVELTTHVVSPNSTPEDIQWTKTKYTIKNGELNTKIT